MTSTRAILVSEEQRDGLAAVDRSVGSFRVRQVLSAYDNAGDQPRIRWCVEHGEQAFYTNGTRCPAGIETAWRETTPCRVVTAIIVPLEEDA